MENPRDWGAWWAAVYGVAQSRTRLKQLSSSSSSSSSRLQIINEAVVPLHLMVPNPYTLLSEIPERAKYFSVIDLKDAFYSVPLAEESQFYLPLKTLCSQLLS